MIGPNAALALREIAGPVLVLDDQGRIVQASDDLLRLLGTPSFSLQGKSLDDLVIDPLSQIQSRLRQFAGSGNWIAGHFTFRGLNGLEIPFPCQGKVLQRPQNNEPRLLVLRRSETPGFTALAHRLSEKQTAARQRYSVEFLLHLSSFALDHAPDIMFWIDQNAQILMTNEKACQRLGYTREEIFALRIPDIDPNCTEEKWNQHWKKIKDVGTLHFERQYRCKDGHLFPVEISAAYLFFQGHELNFAVARDISERKQTEQTIEELAFYDRLTGLPNRTLLLDRLQQALTAAHRSKAFGAVLLIDLDHFRTLNDAHGHEAGDELLKQAAQRLLQSVREGDTVARPGGDEFVVVPTGLGQSEEEAARAVEVLAKKIQDVLSQTYHLDTLQHQGSASIGAVLFGTQTNSTENLLKQAELAMYKSKDSGRNTLRFFNPTLESAIQNRIALENDLRQALTTRQFLLHYQPQIIGNKIIGAEVLVRWRHPERGLVSPLEFIPLAEETGLILQLGQQVLEMACQQLARWRDDPVMKNLTISVNISAHQIHQADFVTSVLTTLDDYTVAPGLLKLELTESLLVSHVEDIIAKMYSLKARSIGFSLDDFGTGYSSLSYLKRLPLDQLKIDQSFVRDVLVDPNDATIARTIIALAQNLGLGVIAEGVETEAQQQFLAAAGCHAYQGYFFSRPLPVEDFEAFVQSRA